MQTYLRIVRYFKKEKFDNSIIAVFSKLITLRDALVQLQQLPEKMVTNHLHELYSLALMPILVTFGLIIKLGGK